MEGSKKKKKREVYSKQREKCVRKLLQRIEYYQRNISVEDVGNIELTKQKCMREADKDTILRRLVFVLKSLGQY